MFKINIERRLFIFRSVCTCLAFLYVMLIVCFSFSGPGNPDKPPLMDSSGSDSDTEGPHPHHHHQQQAQQHKNPASQQQQQQQQQQQAVAAVYHHQQASYPSAAVAAAAALYQPPLHDQYQTLWRWLRDASHPWRATPSPWAGAPHTHPLGNVNDVYTIL